MKIFNNKFEFCFEIDLVHFRTHLIKIDDKNSFVFFLLSFGVGIDIAKCCFKHDPKKEFFFYIDILKKYDPSREAPGFRIRVEKWDQNLRKEGREN